MRIVSTETMIKQCAGLTDKDLNERSLEFIAKIARRQTALGYTGWMTDAQIEWLVDIWKKHFA